MKLPNISAVGNSRNKKNVLYLQPKDKISILCSCAYPPIIIFNHVIKNKIYFKFRQYGTFHFSMQQLLINQSPFAL